MKEFIDKQELIDYFFSDVSEEQAREENMGEVITFEDIDRLFEDIGRVPVREEAEAVGQDDKIAQQLGYAKALDDLTFAFNEVANKISALRSDKNCFFTLPDIKQVIETIRKKSKGGNKNEGELERAKRICQ